MIETALGKKKPLIDREIIVLAVILLFLPFVLPYKSLTPEILIYALGAVAFNILLGYTGMLSFGQGALFGAGAYMTGLMLLHLQVHPLLALLCGCLIGAATAFIIGFFSIRQVGIYFVMLTLAFNQLVFFIAYQWKGLTGGDDGLLGVPRPDFSIFPGSRDSNPDQFAVFFICMGHFHPGRYCYQAHPEFFLRTRFGGHQRKSGSGSRYRI